MLIYFVKVVKNVIFQLLFMDSTEKVSLVKYHLIAQLIVSLEMSTRNFQLFSFNNFHLEVQT